jgi:hypothetical protein
MRTTLTLVLTLLTAPVVWAQDPPQNPPAAQRPAPRGQRAGPPPLGPAQMQQSRLVQEMLDTWALTAAERRLQLTREQNPVFFQAYRDLQGLRQQHRMRRQRLIQELRQLTRPNAGTDAATLTTKTKALDDSEAEWATARAQALAAVDRVLTPVQRARLRVFEEEMEIRKLELIAQVMGSDGTAPVPETGTQPRANRGRGGGGR